jgi:hypothetical protein
MIIFYCGGMRFFHSIITMNQYVILSTKTYHWLTLHINHMKTTYMSSEVLTAFSVYIMIFWSVAPWSLADW